MGAFVYMLRCADGSFYVGSATGDDLTLRIAQHEAGTFEGYTSLRRPVELVWSEHFDRIADAIAVERKIKGWSRKKKEALINGDLSAGPEGMIGHEPGRRPSRLAASATRTSG
jgi:putative endonuclease